ncbi:MAG: gliding motility-associated C-terminal domain-containing protein [Oceanihabitans sp.]
MLQKLFFIVAILICFNMNGQSTDLSISVEAQNLSGSSISQAHIYEEFQYLVTISNSGNTTSAAQFSQSINPDVTVVSYISQNATLGATPITNFNLNANVLTGTITTMPMSSSIEVKIIVRAPTYTGGIATTATINSPNATDTNTSNNSSVISIDVVDVVVDFTVSLTQITPTVGTPINAWGDVVTYQFTITNNSVIDYELDGFTAFAGVNSPFSYGSPIIKPLSVNCIQATGGATCVDLPAIPDDSIELVTNGDFVILEFSDGYFFVSGGALTFEMQYQFLEPDCSIENLPIATYNYIHLTLDHENISSNNSNEVITNLIQADLCNSTDLCINTIQTNPATNIVNFEEEVTFETTFCNNGPIDSNAIAYLRNTSPGIDWEIISVTCISSTNPNDLCDTISFSIISDYWVTNNFFIPVDATVLVETVVKFKDPECSFNPDNNIGKVKSGISIGSPDLFDHEPTNNIDEEDLILPPDTPCTSDFGDITITKTQISPDLPEGSSPSNTTAWGPIAYEIEVSNLSEFDAYITLSDYVTTTTAIATLVSVECVATTGTASCFTVTNANIGVPFDGVPDDDGNPDVFWEVLDTENKMLPALSAITFHVVVNWQPLCSLTGIPVKNIVSVTALEPFFETNTSNNTANSTTYFAPCVDLIVQTFPEFTSVSVNDNFNWIVDVTNSNVSSNAVDVYFEDVLDNAFTLNGTPTCTVTSGNATCITSFNISGNTISGIIPFMEENSTVQISIPVTAPSYGGAFINTAEAVPNIINNEEQTPETNISVSSVLVLAPSVSKIFQPDLVYTNNESTLTFTVNNINTSGVQNNISFTDNLPNGLVLASNPQWENSNGSTATFLGTIGDTFVGVSNLSMPQGVASCTFSVQVVSATVNYYVNDASNFSDQNNIDTSQIYATLEVVEDPSNVDIEVLKNVNPTEAEIGETVTFTISVANLGTTNATLVEVLDQLPDGYVLDTFTTSYGDYNQATGIWSLPLLLPNQTETLTITAQVVAATNLLNTASLLQLQETDLNSNNNLDTAEVQIVVVPVNVDIEVLKNVNLTEAEIGETVTFTISVANLGTTNATLVEVLDQLPDGYVLDTFTTSYGDYNQATGIWSLPLLLPNQTETLTITAQVVATTNLLNTASLFQLNEVETNTSNNSSQAAVTVSNCLTIPQAFSPNNDLLNDTFVIPCIRDYGENYIKIFNRYGVLVYEMENYNNSWNGKPNRGMQFSANEKLPIGTYFYILEIKSIAYKKTSWIYLNY